MKISRRSLFVAPFAALFSRFMGPKRDEARRFKEWLRMEYLYYIVSNPGCDREDLWRDFDRVTSLSEGLVS